MIQLGRPFLRHLYAIRDIGSHPSNHNHLNLAAAGAESADILWWHVFASERNGTSMLWDLDRSTTGMFHFSEILQAKQYHHFPSLPDP